MLDVADPEFLRLTMVKEFNSMPNRRSLFFGMLFDKFMTALTDDHWRHVRSSLSPTFTSGKLKLVSACRFRSVYATQTIFCEMQESSFY